MALRLLIAGAAKSMPGMTRLATGVRHMSIDRDLTGRDHAQEKVYINKQDEENLRKLLRKMKEGLAGGPDEHVAKEEASLAKIVGKYNISKADIAALIKWKHEH